MREFSVYMYEKDGKYGAVGVSMSPMPHEKKHAEFFQQFRHEDTLISVVGMNCKISVSYAQQIAQHFYNGKAKHYEMSDKYYTPKRKR